MIEIKYYSFNFQPFHFHRILITLKIQDIFIEYIRIIINKIMSNSQTNELLYNKYKLGKLIYQDDSGKISEIVDQTNSKQYSIKAYSKADLVKDKKLEYMKNARNIMERLNHTHILSTYLVFQDLSNLYFVVDPLCPDLSNVLKEYKALDIPCVRTISAQVLLGLAYLHQQSIIHRNLSPESIAFDSNNIVKITHLANSIHCDEKSEASSDTSFIENPDYISPELLNNQIYSFSSDLWSFGCFIFTLIAGYPPFHESNKERIFSRIKSCQYTFPDFIPENAKSLIGSLLNINPAQRLGSNTMGSNYREIRDHPFFQGINWETISNTSTSQWASFEPASKCIKSFPQEKENKEEKFPPFPTEVKELLVDGEYSIFEGPVTKRVGFSVTKRRLVLTSKPRLFYVDMEKSPPLIKGEIELCKDMIIVVGPKNKWQITVPGRTYNLTSDEAEKWKTILKKFLETL